MPYLRDFSLLFWYNESIKIKAVFPMMTQNADKKREQIQMFCMDDLVPQDHLLRLIDQAIDWSFIYDLVIDKYSTDNGRPSMDPVMLIKIPFIQYLYGIRSMRQTVKEIEVNVAYRWFLGLEMMDKVPHFSTFGKNYTRRFKDTDLFEQIFSRILQECYKYRLIDPSEVFVDATHVKARANSKKMRKRIADKVVTRHIWEPYMEKCEDIRHTIGMKEVYAQRKETVERLFGTAKENHGLRYTQMIGKARMEMKVGLTFACMNLKKLAKMIARKGKRGTQKCLLLIKYTLFEPKTRKTLLEC